MILNNEMLSFSKSAVSIFCPSIYICAQFVLVPRLFVPVSLFKIMKVVTNLKFYC